MHLQCSSLCSKQAPAPEAQRYIPSYGRLKKHLLTMMPQKKASKETADMKPCLQTALAALYLSGWSGKEELALITVVKHPCDCSMAIPQDESLPIAAAPEPPAKPLGLSEW